MFEIINNKPFMDYLSSNYPKDNLGAIMKSGGVKIIKEDDKYKIVFKQAIFKEKFEQRQESVNKLFKIIVNTDYNIDFILDYTDKYVIPLTPAEQEQKNKEREIAKKEEEENKKQRYIESMNMKMRNLFNQSRIPYSKKDEYTFEKYQSSKENQKAFDLIQNHVDGFLTMCGGTGIGKTHLAMACGIKAIYEDCESVIYYQSEELLDILRRSFNIPDVDKTWGDGTEPNYNDSYDGMIRRLQGIDILILDDFGTQKNSDWVLSKLDMIIDYRYINEKNTIITTNLSMKSIKDISERISSRLSSGTVVTLVGQDYRLAHKQTIKNLPKPIENDRMEGMHE